MADRVTDIQIQPDIRLLGPDDSVAGLTDLLHRAYKRHADSGLAPVAANQPESVTRRRISGGECHVARIDGRVVGTILFRHAGIVGPRGGTPWLDRPDVASFSQFAVDPDFQGRGIGRLLMAGAERRAAETGATEVALSTPEPAAWLVAMYQRHGYRIVERWHWDETNYVSAIMSKRVAR